MRLHAEINTHIERVGTQKSWRWNLRGQVWVPWGWESMRGGTLAPPFCTTRGDFKSRLTGLIWIFQTSWSNRLTLWVALEFKCWRLGPPLQRKVGHLSSALTQQHTSPTKQDLLQLKTTGQKLHVILQPHFHRSKGTHLSLWYTYFHMHTLKVLIYDLIAYADANLQQLAALLQSTLFSWGTCSHMADKYPRLASSNDGDVIGKTWSPVLWRGWGTWRWWAV